MAVGVSDTCFVACYYAHKLRDLVSTVCWISNKIFFHNLNNLFTFSCETLLTYDLNFVL